MAYISRKKKDDIVPSAVKARTADDNSTPTPHTTKSEEGTTSGGIGNIIGTSTNTSTNSSTNTSTNPSTYASYLTSGSEGSLARVGSVSSGSDDTGEGSADQSDLVRRTREELGMHGADGKLKPEYVDTPPTPENSKVNAENAKVTSRENSENEKVLKDVNTQKMPDIRINPRLDAKGIAHAKDGKEVYVKKKESEKSVDDLVEEHRLRSEENQRNISEQIDAGSRLIEQWRKDDDARRERYERDERKSGVLDNIMRGFEMLFNGHNVRHGGLNVKGADDARKEAKNERYARYQRDRQALKDQYDKAAQSNRTLLDKLQRKAANDNAEFRDKVSYKLKSNEDARKEQTAVDKHETTVAANAEREARTQRTIANITNDAAKTQSTIARNAAASAASYAAANKNNAAARNGGTLGGSGKSKPYRGGSTMYDIPSNVNISDMNKAIMKELGIPTEYEKKSSTGYTTETKKYTQAERERMLHDKWDKRAEEVVKQYGGTVRSASEDEKQPSSSSSSSSSKGKTSTSAPSSASGKSGGVSSGGTGVWGSSINRKSKK